MISTNHSIVATDQNAILIFQKKLRLWAISLLLIAGISVFDPESIDPIWGLMLIVVVILTWKNSIPALFIVFAVIMGWAGLINSLNIVMSQGIEKLWSVLGLVEIVYTVLVVRQYRKYRQFQVGNKDVVLQHFGMGSALLSFALLVLTPCLCVVFFFAPNSGALAVQTGLVKQFPLRLDMIAFYILMDLAVLAFGLGLAVVISEKNNTGPAILGVIISAVQLAGIIGFIIVGSIGMLMT